MTFFLLEVDDAAMQGVPGVLENKKTNKEPHLPTCRS